MGLLLALHQVLRAANDVQVSLYAATIDHALRPEAANEAKAVAVLCKTLGIRHYTRRWDEPKPKSGLSAASRLARYRLIGAVADKIAADVIVTAHTLGDQSETIAMCAERSTRDDNLGLAGMADAVLYDRRHWIMRPFLDCERQDIRRFLSASSQCWFDDPSNLDHKYERVRVREAVSQMPEAVAHGTAKRREEISLEAAHWIKAYARCYHASLVAISADGLAVDDAVLRHGLSALVSVIGGRSFGLAAESMDRVMDFVGAARPGRITAGRVVFDRRRDGLYLMRECRNLPRLSVAAGATAIWDDRLSISNARDKAVTICAVGEGANIDMAALFPEVPAGVAKRAALSLPCVEQDGAPILGQDGKGLILNAVLKPYDLFLPRFDLALANAISGIVGRAPYPQPPV
jgi:tRNA(Ile)-lysidine synthase